MDKIVNTKWDTEFAVGFESGSFPGYGVEAWYYVCTSLFGSWRFRPRKFFASKGYILYPIPNNKFIRSMQEKYLKAVCETASSILAKDYVRHMEILSDKSFAHG